MIENILPNGDVEVQAWECTYPGVPGCIVYTPKLALDKVSEGYDVQILKITRRPGRGPLIQPGLLVNA
jgi:hypothetical protein